jgi:glutamyl-tRNA reductase
MYHILLLGMNHNTAPVEIREQLALSCQQHVSPLHLIPHLPHVDEVFFLSTCNRVEFLFTCQHRETAMAEVKALLLSYLGNPPESLLESHLYAHENLEAVRHLFRVSSSLDSMVVGEPQILGQIKVAYREATECHTVRVILNRLLHKSFSVAKRVRSETMIGSHAVSISYAAVELARKIFGELKDKRVLLVGAGEMAELAAEHLLAQGVRHMTVTNRTQERAFDLARRFRADTIPFEHLVDGMRTMDIVLTSTGSPDPIVRYQEVRSRMRERRNRPLFFIDIAVPRDVEARVNEIDNVYLYDIDDLQGIVNLNREDRKREAAKAEYIVSEETLKFQYWLETLDVVPTIVALREKAETIRSSELQRTFAQLPELSDRERHAIEVLAGSIVKKLLHDPILFLKKKANRDSKAHFVDYTQQLFNLANGNGAPSSSLTDGSADAKKESKILKNINK